MVNIKSNPPKNNATTREIPMTIKVDLMVSFLVGQLTLFNSCFASFKKLMVFVGNLLIFTNRKTNFANTISEKW